MMPKGLIRGFIVLENVSKEDLCQISLTGIRSLVLLGLLIDEPRSLEDIRKAFIGYNIMEGSNSDDILRIDMNTLKSIGCEISRADHRTNNKYKLLSHPFKINIEEKEINVLKRAFNNIKENADISVIMQYDSLFKKIAKYVSNEDIKEQLAGLSPLKSYNLGIIDELKIACKHKKLVKLIYKSPAVSTETTKQIIADKVIMQNNKLYFYGVDKDSEQAVYLNIRRILKILFIGENNDNITVMPVKVKFFLKDFGVPGLDENENIISGDIPDGFIIEGEYHNEFLAIQRMLSFGSRCTVIEPEEIKNKIVDILKNMKEIYNG